MGILVDTKRLIDETLPAYEQLNNDSFDRTGKSRGRSLRFRVFDTVTHSDCGILDPKQEAALDWQVEPEVKVLHHLKQLAATTRKPGVGSARPGSGGVDSMVGTTTLVASVQSSTCTQHRTSSSCSYSTLCVQETNIRNKSRMYYGDTSLERVIFNIDVDGFGKQPKLVSTDAEGQYHSVNWRLVQFGFINLSSQSTYSEKRRRTLNLFHHDPLRRDEDHTTRAHDPPAAPEAKRFKGVRYRPDHNRWVAEMKPPRSKNKVWFGELRTQADAARVVDVAFYHYGTPLNFPNSTPPLLSSHPHSAGLSAEAKLEVIRQQTKWMKLMVSSLPPPNRSTSDTNSGLRPFSAIG